MFSLKSLSSCRHWQTQPHRLRPILLASCRILYHTNQLARRKGPGRRHYHYDAKPEDIRNIGIIAHVDAGKTTTTERMLFHSGLIKHLGNVDHGDTVTDFLPMERDRGITIQSAAITFHWPPLADCAPGTHSKTINLIDTPGHQDFRFEVDRCMPVLDGAVCIIDSVKGVEAHTERVWASAQEFKIPRILYVNKLDRDGASFKRSVSEVATRLNSWPLVCQIPWWDKDNFIGVIDVINQTGFKWKSSGSRVTFSPEKLKETLLATDPALAEEIGKARLALIDKLCEHDESLLLEQDLDKVPPEVIKKGIRRLISSGDGLAVPVVVGSSLKNIGVDQLLNAVVDYLPSADERPPMEVSVDRVKSTLDEFIQAHNTDLKQKSSNKRAPGIGAVASVFKVATDLKSHDQSRSMLSFIKVYHGSLPRMAEVWNTNRSVFEKPMGIVQIAADKTHQIPHLSQGQIGALQGLKEAKTGDTLLHFTGGGHKAGDSPLRKLEIRPAEVPHPVAFITMTPNSQSGLKNIEVALDRLSREDPSLRYSFNDKTDEFILSGMGRLHLEVSLDRLKKLYKVEATVSNIEVEYKECLLEATEPHRSLFDQVVNSRTGKAACTASLEPRASDEEVPENSFEMDEGNFIRIFVKDAEGTRNLSTAQPEGFDEERTYVDLLHGASAALRSGPRLRRPIHDCVVNITFDMSTDYFGPATPSSHYIKAAYNAVKACLKDAHSKSRVGILEPVMSVDISCPETAAGEIQHDITSSRGGIIHEVKDSNSDGYGTSKSGSGSDGGDDAPGAEESAGRIMIDDVYLPPDPYESVQSLRDPKKGMMRMLEIKAVVPLKEMLDYDARLRSMTGGRHSLNMTLDTFQRVTGPREKAIG